MTHRNETEYLLQREREERARAEVSTDVTARRVHLDMAQRYRERAMRGTESIAA